MLLAQFTWALLFSPFGIAVAAVVSCFAWLIIACAGETIAKIMQDRNDTDLKRDLIAQGLSTDEVVRIVEAGRGKKHRTADRHQASQRPA